jgi:peptidoglycan hydrolase-like protein with peptidoglycan-binding domain
MTDEDKPVEDKPVAPKPKAKPKPPPAPRATAVVGGGEQDDVLLSKMVKDNLKGRKSLSVHHLQRRLTELGYGEAGADIDGRYGQLTEVAVAKFQKDRDLDETGAVDAETLKAIFEGDPNCRVVIDA